MTLALFGSRWEQLSGQFLGEGWVVAVKELRGRVPDVPDPELLSRWRYGGAEDVRVKFSAESPDSSRRSRAEALAVRHGWRDGSARDTVPLPAPRPLGLVAR